MTPITVVSVSAILNFVNELQVGRLSVLFTGEAFRERQAGGLEFINRLILISTFGSKNKVYTLETQIPVLADDLIEV